jgi:hypothetical protein
MKWIRLAFLIPVLVGLVSFAFTANQYPANMDRASGLIVQAATPWWLSVLEFLLPIAGTMFGAFLIIAFMAWLVRSKEV